MLWQTIAILALLQVPELQPHGDLAYWLIGMLLAGIVALWATFMLFIKQQSRDNSRREMKMAQAMGELEAFCRNTLVDLVKGMQGVMQSVIATMQELREEIHELREESRDKREHERNRNRHSN